MYITGRFVKFTQKSADIHKLYTNLVASLYIITDVTQLVEAFGLVENISQLEDHRQISVSIILMSQPIIIRFF